MYYFKNLFLAVIFLRAVTLFAGGEVRIEKLDKYVLIHLTDHSEAWPCMQIREHDGRLTSKRIIFKGECEDRSSRPAKFIFESLQSTPGIEKEEGLYLNKGVTNDIQFQAPLIYGRNIAYSIRNWADDFYYVVLKVGNSSHYRWSKSDGTLHLKGKIAKSLIELIESANSKLVNASGIYCSQFLLDGIDNYECSIDVSPLDPSRKILNGVRPSIPGTIPAVILKPYAINAYDYVGCVNDADALSDSDDDEAPSLCKHVGEAFKKLYRRSKKAWSRGE